ncbi:fumarylacetoacetate hydrolase family protein [Lentibacillus salicampi]|uniref:DUF2437 domain-containing protein n=1 Tax=Lentibacillus salicampi TaxID=175306 RepID=A0A4Y9ADI8_9BACI|nr:fumarylacetoacetate hydrolase family protein [Lentibacillus salicampi]TFJ92464.1 DUF2437 domain-containing protein [Lentibacillus salicampi]
MKFIRFKPKNSQTILQGIVTDMGFKPIAGDMFTGDWEVTGNFYTADSIKILEPLTPRHVIGIGANYVAEPNDLPAKVPDLPVFFYKPVSSVIGGGKPIVIPEGTSEVKFESELAVVMGKRASDLSEEEVTDYIFGYTVANDVTAPKFFHDDGHWTVGKSFDTFTPLGPCIETDFNPDGARVEAYLNGEKKQDSPTANMIVPMRKMVAYLSSVMTLEAGDVILTGSPLGAEMITDDDYIICSVKGIGDLQNPVVQKVSARSR